MSNSTFVSEVSICNLALSWLGQPAITSLDDQSTNAELCKLNYPHLRDVLLSERQWVFAVLRHTSETADKPEFGEGFKHSIPPEYLRVSRVYRNVEAFDPNKWRTALGWRREGEFIIAVEEIIYMWGTQQLTDTGLFSPMFTQALAARIAADLCMPITENSTLQSKMYQLYLAKLSDAAASDAVQGANEVIQANRLLDARTSGFTIGRRF